MGDDRPATLGPPRAAPSDGDESRSDGADPEPRDRVGDDAPSALSRRTYLASLATACTGAAAGAASGAAQSAPDVAPSEKRGYVGSDPAGANALGAGWFYDYMPTNDDLDAFETADYLPMINGDDLGWTSGASDAILAHEYDAEYVLGYNEPEHEEGYTDVETILYPHWQTLSEKFRDTDVSICSPSIKTGTETGRAYFHEFMSAVESDDSLVVDEVALHWYAGTEAMRDDPVTQAQWFLDRIESIHQEYERPLWITEFGGPNFANIDADALAASNVVFLQNTIPELERRDYVQGYAWWEGGRATRLTEVVDGAVQLTDVGRAYVGLDASEPNRLTDLPTTETVAPGRYQLVSVNSGHVLEVADAADGAGGADADGTEANGADVQQGADEDAAHQQWDVEYDGDGRYRLLAAHSGAAADVADASAENGANVQQWTANDGEHQRWHLDPLADDQYRVVAAHSGLVLDVFDESTADGATVGQWEWTGGDNQRWRLEAVSRDEACDGAAGGAADLDGQTVCDVDGDGNYRDVTGDGSVTNSDVTEFFANQHAPPWNERADLFDFTGDDAVSQADVIELFESL